MNLLWAHRSKVSRIFKDLLSPYQIRRGIRNSTVNLTQICEDESLYSGSMRSSGRVRSGWPPWSPTCDSFDKVASSHWRRESRSGLCLANGLAVGRESVPRLHTALRSAATPPVPPPNRLPVPDRRSGVAHTPSTPRVGYDHLHRVD